ncbi:MAG: hypothetical protein V3T72_06635 [Thermoanaerobaculia bacterium]
MELTWDGRSTSAAGEGLGLANKSRKTQPDIPGAEDFAPGAVNRAVLTETLQHPLTILPAAAAAVGAVYMGLLGPDAASFAATFGSMLVAGGAWIFNYFIRGEAFAERHVKKLRRQRETLRREELRSLESEWSTSGHEEGTRQALELRQAYQKLDEFLRSRFDGDGGSSLNAQRLMMLAEDTYREGVVILRQALEAHRALRLVDRDKLELELFEWRAELGQLRRSDADTAEDVRAAGLDTRIAAHERRLRLIAGQEKSVEQLLAESETLEAALESAYLEAVDLQSPEAFFNHGRAAEELERAVTAARRVEERLRSMSGPTAAEDEIYLTAAERRR